MDESRHLNTLAGESNLQEKADLHAFFARMVAKRWWIIGSVILFTAGFSAKAFLTTPVYRATTVLAPATADRGADVVGFASTPLGGLASGLGIGPRDAEMEEALAVLQSREFTQGFISSRNLLPKIFPGKWNSVTGTWKVDDDHRPTLAKAFKYFDKYVRLVSRDRKTGLVALQIDWADREEAANWANDLVRRLNEEMRARAIAKADASMRFLERELQTTSTVGARDAVSRLLEAQVKQRMLADVTQDYSFRVVDKAIPADKDDPVKPRRMLLVLTGPLLGLVCGMLCALTFNAPSRARESRADQRTP